MNKKPMLKSDMYIDTGVPWSLATLSTMIGKTTMTIKKMMDEGLPFTMTGNAYLFDSKIAVQWIIDHEVKKAIPTPEEGGKIGVHEAKRRYEVARALQAELALAKEREQLANIDDLMENFSDALVQVRAKLISMPNRLSGLLSHQEEEFIAESLETDITEILEVLSGYQHEYIKNESVSEEDDSADDNGSFSYIPISAPKVEPR
mgnify:FL=1